MTMLMKSNKFLLSSSHMNPSMISSTTTTTMMMRTVHLRMRRSCCSSIWRRKESGGRRGLLYSTSSDTTPNTAIASSGRCWNNHRRHHHHYHRRQNNHSQSTSVLPFLNSTFAYLKSPNMRPYYSKIIRANGNSLLTTTTNNKNLTSSLSARGLSSSSKTTTTSTTRVHIYHHSDDDDGGDYNDGSKSGNKSDEEDFDDEEFYGSYGDGTHGRSSKHNSGGTVLVVGCCGSLGRTVTQHLRTRHKMKIIGADVVVPPEKDDGFKNCLSAFIEMPISSSSNTDHPPSLVDTTTALVDGLSQIMMLDDEIDDDEQYDDEDYDDFYDDNMIDGGSQKRQNKNNKLTAIVCVAGGWEGDPPLPSVSSLSSHSSDEEDSSSQILIEGARRYASVIERMMSKNLNPLLAAGYASNYFLRNDSDGLFVAIGATPALNPTPGMVGYGLSKSSTHHFIQTIGELTETSVATKKASKRRLGGVDNEPANTGMTVVGILPTTIDTPMNRQAMPTADFSKWTKSIDIAKQIGQWIERPIFRPHSGSLVKVYPKSGKGNSSDDDDDDNVGAVFQLAR